MGKRTFFHALPAMVSAHLALTPRLRANHTAYTAVLAADLHTDADPYRDRTDVLRKAFAGVTKRFGRVNAFVMAGDITNCGDEKEYRLLQRLTDTYLRADKLIPALGNHDSWHHSDHPCYEIAYRLFRDFCKSCGHRGTENYYTYEDAFCTYLVLGTERTMHNSACLSARQLDWLEAELQIAVKREKFTVVVNHQPLAKRNGGDAGWEEEGQAAVSERLDRMLLSASEQAKQTILFVSGHKHMLSFDCYERVSDKLVFLNLPSFEYGGGKPETHRGAAAVLQVYRNRTADLIFYDFILQQRIPLPKE